MDQQPLLRLAPPYCHVQRLQHRIGGLPALHRPAHHAAGIEIDYDSQIGKAFHGADVSDVCHPGPVSRRHVKLGILGIINRQGRLTALIAPPTLIANLRLDTCQPA